MVDEGLAPKLDSNTTTADNAFTAGTIAMTLESTGSLSGFLKSSEGKFDIATGNYPKINTTDAGGPIIGGASLWVVGKGKDDAHKRASWEFVKFLSDKDSQATWHTSTGYFPISKGALETEVDKQWVAQRPQFQTAITQLQNTPLSKATQGCLLGAMPQARKAAEQAMQAAVLSGTEPRAALEQQQEALAGPVKDYNQSVTN